MSDETGFTIDPDTGQFRLDVSGVADLPDNVFEDVTFNPEFDIFNSPAGSGLFDNSGTLNLDYINSLTSDPAVFSAFAEFDPEAAAVIRNITGEITTRSLGDQSGITTLDGASTAGRDEVEFAGPNSRLLTPDGDLTSTGTSALTGEGIIADAAADKISGELGGDTDKITSLTQDPEDVATAGVTTDKTGTTTDKTGTTTDKTGTTTDKKGLSSLSDLLKYFLPALASYLSYKSAKDAQEQARGASFAARGPVTSTRTTYGGSTYKPAAQGGLMSLAGGGSVIGEKSAATPYQVYDKASDTYRYVDAAGYEKWLSGIPLTPINTVQGSPVYYGAPSKAEGDYDIGGGGLSYISEEPPPPPRYDIYGNQLEDDPYFRTMTGKETDAFEEGTSFDPEARARLLEPLRNAFMSTNAVGDLDVQQTLRNIYNNPETRELFYEYTNQLKDAPYDAAEWFQKYNELVQRSEEEGFTPDREYMPLEGIELARINRKNRYLPRDIANEMFRLIAPNTPDTVIKNYGDVKGNLPEDYVVTDRGQAIEPNQGLSVDDLYYGTPLSEMGVFDGGGGKRGGVVHKPHYAAGGMTTKQPFYLGGPTDGMADEVPAHIDNKRPAALSDGEFVIPADVVSHLGNGNSNAGAKRLYEMMDNIRQARTGNKNQGIQINPNQFMPR